jgi:hypothetical protein
VRGGGGLGYGLLTAEWQRLPRKGALSVQQEAKKKLRLTKIGEGGRKRRKQRKQRKQRKGKFKESGKESSNLVGREGVAEGRAEGKRHYKIV